MWNKTWRNDIWNALDRPWDLLIIGGGITGAGIMREAVRAGLRVLLVEQHDFSYGTSSRSSKLVHGGLRYLKEGQITLTRDSVRERELLLQAAPGLVEPLNFLFAHRSGRGEWVEKLVMNLGLGFFDLLAARWNHRYVNKREFGVLAPRVETGRMAGAFQYADAQTDDARLVLRLLREGVRAGGTALNYAAASGLLRENDRVVGVVLEDKVSGRKADVRAGVVINATGAWADRLRGEIGEQEKLRPLRGSHLIFPQWRFPLAQAVSFPHPFDKRPVFAFPWEGVTLFGTTDIDHHDSLAGEPRISGEEVTYLMAALETYFADLHLTLDDICATFAGVRPVIDTGQKDPSKESRDHVVWMENGLMTVTGGKLTTFRLIAQDALRTLKEKFPALARLDEEAPPLAAEPPQLPAALPFLLRRRLIGRYGMDAADLVTAADETELQQIPGTLALWAELRWAARDEGVVHLDDLLLRRVRLGLLLPDGGAANHARIRAICQPELGWDDRRWEEEWAAYRALWIASYDLPPRAEIPDWRERLTGFELEQAKEPSGSAVRPVFAGVLAGLAVGLTLFYWIKRPRRA